MSETNQNGWFTGQYLPTQADPRVLAYPLMNTWTPTALISLAYVIGVYLWRAEIVKRQQSNKHKDKSKSSMNTASEEWTTVTYLMVLYNALMVLYSAVTTFGSLWTTYNLGYGLGCVEQPDPNDKSTDILVFYGYLFYVSKFIEMLDTVFFLWRGRVDQVTFLHVFHHASMPPSIWWGLKYAPGGIVYMFPLANSFIHIIMYTYYGMAAAGLYRYLWWKNYLTIAQMIQFVLLIVHQGQVFYRSTPCNYPKVFPLAIVIYATLFLILFGNFYIQAYWRKQRLAKSVRAKSSVTNSDQSEANGHTMKNGDIKVANGYANGVRQRKADA